MENENKTYFRELFPLWLDGIKSWYGWGGWRKTLTSLVISIGIIYTYLYFNQVELALENIGQFFLSIVIAGLWFLFVVVITYIIANIKLHDKHIEIEKENCIRSVGITPT